jgi:hypothetical protein
VQHGDRLPDHAAAVVHERAELLGLCEAVWRGAGRVLRARMRLLGDDRVQPGGVLWQQVGGGQGELRLCRDERDALAATWGAACAHGVCAGHGCARRPVRAADDAGVCLLQDAIACRVWECAHVTGVRQHGDAHVHWSLGVHQRADQPGADG